MAEQKIIGVARVVTLGCRLNTADSALICSALGECGYRLSESDPPQVVVVNTCAVTAEAERKTRQLLRKLRREFPQARIIAVGCAADADMERLLASGADAACGNAGKRQLPLLLKSGSISASPEDESPATFQEKRLSSHLFRSRAFIKIQEGCNNRCSYCIVPLLRGRARSRDFGEVMAECRHALAQGFSELVLTGVNTCSYSDGGRRLPELLRAISGLPGDFRIRLGSTEPALRHHLLVDAVAELPRMCRFLHLSLQHGSDRVLQRMNRRYTAGEYAAFAAEAKHRIPGLHLGTDVIVGFPGETESEFAESCRFIESVGFANIHIFTYSPRPGTPAAVMPDRPDGATVRRRSEILREIARASAKTFANSQIGQTLPVIFERVENQLASGWSDNYLKVTIPAAGIATGKITRIVASAENTSPGAAEGEYQP